MIRALLALCLVLPLCSRASDHVLAYRPGVAVTNASPWASLPLSTYTNATAWFIDSTLTDYSSERTDAYRVDSPCITLNGTDQYGELDELLDFSEGQYFEITFKTSVSQTGYVFSQLGYGTATESSECKVLFVSGGLDVTVKGDSTDSLTGYSDGDWHSVSFTVGAITTDVYIDGVFISTLTHGTPFTSTTALVGAKYGPATFFEGSICCLVNHPITEKSGLTSYDVSGNGNNITWNVGSGSSTVMWSGTQSVTSYFHDNGGLTFTNGSSTVYVPQLVDGTAPATNAISGYAVALTNGPDYIHNGGPYSLSNSVVGTVTYSDMLTNSTCTATTEDGMVTELYIEN